MSTPNRHDTLGAAELVQLLRGDTPFALFDARDEGLFARAHLLFAAPLPLSDLEARLLRLVPERDTLIVLTSTEGDGMAERAAARCAALGYRHVRLLDGGNQGWERAGMQLFRGMHVPSKAFGELVEHHYHTPMIEPTTLHSLMASGAKVRVFDCRPPNEYHRMNLPGARNCPGADLLSRVPAQIAPDTELVVINCAGRTRSIIGAQSLINAGLSTPVVALKNGTMGWHLAGFALEHGRQDLVEPVAADALGAVRDQAARLRERFGIPVVGLERLQRADGPAPLLLDVRGPWEYDKGHLPGARNAPGGQLVQATDYYVAVRNLPLVLVDDDGVRASVTASWLVQMGFADVSVLDHGPALARFTETGPFQAVPPHLCPPVPRVGVPVLQAELAEGRTLLLDLGRSDTYYKGHIPGARFAIRSRLAQTLVSVLRTSGAASLTLMADDNATAAFAAVEAAALSGLPVRVLDDGLAAWTAAGLPLVPGLDDALDPPEDMWHIPSSPLGGGEAAMKDYLRWEVDLALQVLNEPGARFKPGAALFAERVEAPPAWVDADPLFRRRWSPRAMSGAALRAEEVRALFEAARWAPSCNNAQPWRFVYALAGTPHWDAFFDLLSEGNKRWAGRGGLMGFVLSVSRDPGTGKPLRSHAYDAGAAWQNLALQGHLLGLVVHGMLGFDAARARERLDLPDDVEIHAMFVAGRPAAADVLPDDLRRRELPSGRLPLHAIAFEGHLAVARDERLPV